MKILWSILITAALATLVSFKWIEDDRVEIKVTSEKSVTFDFYAFGEHKYLKKMKTPYTFISDSTVAQYIFKSNNPKIGLKVETRRLNGQGSGTINNLSLIVLVRDHKTLTSFGIDWGK